MILGLAFFLQFAAHRNCIDIIHGLCRLYVSCTCLNDVCFGLPVRYSSNSAQGSCIYYNDSFSSVVPVMNYYSPHPSPNEVAMSKPCYTRNGRYRGSEV